MSRRGSPQPEEFDRCQHKVVKTINSYELQLVCPRTGDGPLLARDNDARVARMSEKLREAAIGALCSGCALADMSPVELIDHQTDISSANARAMFARADELQARARLLLAEAAVIDAQAQLDESRANTAVEAVEQPIDQPSVQ